MKKFSLNKINEIMSLPLGDLLFKSQKIHRKSFPKNDVQLASLISIKTGSCPEDCKYCPQSAHYNVDLKKEKILFEEKEKCNQTSSQMVFRGLNPKRSAAFAYHSVPE